MHGQRGACPHDGVVVGQQRLGPARPGDPPAVRIGDQAFGRAQATRQRPTCGGVHVYTAWRWRASMADTLRSSVSTSSLLVTVCNTTRAAATSTVGTPQDRARRSAATASTDAGPARRVRSMLQHGWPRRARGAYLGSSQHPACGLVAVPDAPGGFRDARGDQYGGDETTGASVESSSSVVIRGQISRPRRPACAAFASRIRSTSPGLTSGREPVISTARAVRDTRGTRRWEDTPPVECVSLAPSGSGVHGHRESVHRARPYRTGRTDALERCGGRAVRRTRSGRGQTRSREVPEVPDVDVELARRGPLSTLSDRPRRRSRWPPA